MAKTILPVIILRGAVLFPHCELRLEIKNEIDKKIINESEKFNDNHILIVNLLNPVEENIEDKNLSKIATIGRIKMNMNINDSTKRVIIEGLNRVNVIEYLNIEEKESVLLAEIESTTKFVIKQNDEVALIRKLQKELEEFVNKAPYISNSILSQILEENSISKITDLIANFIPVIFDRKLQYLFAINPYKRVIMILEDIKAEEEIIKLENKIEENLKKHLDDSQKEFILREKIRIIKEELGDISVKDSDIEELRVKIDKLKCNDKIKDKLNSELKKYELLNPNSPELNLVRNYIEWLVELPWNVFTKEEVDLNKVRDALDESHYGLDKVKTRIIEFLAVKQTSSYMKSPIICLVGPPGVGKTTLGISIAKSINRKFTKISVGGINDEAEIRGHRRTYIGANPGRIITAMKRVKSSNPVILIDEIDKMSRDYKGDPASALLEALDKEQNKYFSDNYIEEEYDLSNVLFVLTANELYKIPEPLRDRLEIIELSGYTEYEKLDIAKKHLIKREIKEHNLKKCKVVIEDEAVLTIIRSYTKEAGVRELERLIATIIRKIITENVIEKKSEKEYIITSKNIEKYLGKKKYFDSEKSKESEVGVSIGLAYTGYGGTILPIEVNYFDGKGDLVLTGSLGEVMKESAKIALSYIKSNFEFFNIEKDLIKNSDIHIHVPEGAIPKDGPSAGIALTTALISAFKNKKIKKDTALTGEITLRGTILPIGGLKEKAMGAHRNNIKNVIVPKENERDLDEIPKEIIKDLNFIFVSNYKEVYEYFFKK